MQTTWLQDEDRGGTLYDATELSFMQRPVRLSLMKACHKHLSESERTIGKPHEFVLEAIKLVVTLPLSCSSLSYTH